MEAGPGGRFPRRVRLTRGADYKRVMRRGLRIEGPLFTLYAALASAEAFTRVGLSASRRLGKAVARNRAKRLLRESFRRRSRPPGLDLVLVPKPAILSRTQKEVDDEFRRSLERLASRRPSVRGGANPPPPR